jgi:uncharacterized lipoprotein
MKTAKRWWVAPALLLALAACSSGLGPSADDWTRSYEASYERVWTAVLQALADGGYFVEDGDRERGRIRALSSAERSYKEVGLDIRIVEREEQVRVDVQAGGGSIDSQRGFKRLETLVVEFLTDLDTKLDS